MFVWFLKSGIPKSTHPEIGDIGVDERRRKSLPYNTKIQASERQWQKTKMSEKVYCCHDVKEKPQ